MSPRAGEDEVTPHTRPPADDDADHVLVRTARCIDGSVEVEVVCEPVFDYGRTAADWTLDEDRHTAVTTGAGQTIRLHTDLALGIEGNRVRGRHTLSAGEAVYCALAWGPAGPPPPMWTRPTPGSPPPSASGGRGWGGPASPTIVGVTRSSARP